MFILFLGIRVREVYELLANLFEVRFVIITMMFV